MEKIATVSTKKEVTEIEKRILPDYSRIEGNPAIQPITLSGLLGIRDCSCPIYKYERDLEQKYKKLLLKLARRILKTEKKIKKNKSSWFSSMID